jgi:hypothetical protein
MHPINRNIWGPTCCTLRRALDAGPAGPPSKFTCIKSAAMHVSRTMLRYCSCNTVHQCDALPSRA